MTDKNEMLNEIEDLLGSEGTTEMAEAMFDALESAGEIEFAANDGFSLVAHDCTDDAQRAWETALQSVIEATR